MFPSLSAREVDRLAGLSIGHLRTLETRNGDSAQLDTIAQLAAVYGVSAAWIAYGEGPAPKAHKVIRAVADARARIAIANESAA